MRALIAARASSTVIWPEGTADAGEGAGAGAGAGASVIRTAANARVVRLMERHQLGGCSDHAELRSRFSLEEIRVSDARVWIACLVAGRPLRICEVAEEPRFGGEAEGIFSIIWRMMPGDIG